MNEIIREIETKLAQSIDRISPVSGGSINGTYHLQASNNSYFLKVNNSTIPKDFFTTEAKSLELLKKESFVRTPSVYFSFINVFIDGIHSRGDKIR